MFAGACESFVVVRAEAEQRAECRARDRRGPALGRITTVSRAEGVEEAKAGHLHTSLALMLGAVGS